MLKKILVTLTLFLQASAYADITPALVFKRILQVTEQKVQSNEIPEQFQSKMHMLRIAKKDNQYLAVAVTDHNGDHSKALDHLRFSFNLDGDLSQFKYNSGYTTELPTPFTQMTSIDIIHSFLDYAILSQDESIHQFISTLTMLHLEFDSENQLAIIEAMNEKNENLMFSFKLNGEFVEIIK